MTEILTESFCERCGAKFTFESAPPSGGPLARATTLARGLRNFLTSDESLEEALAEARRDRERKASGIQLQAFHDTFNFCFSCRQYTCRDCWNEAAGKCRTCAPMPGVPDPLELRELQARLDRLEAEASAASLAATAEPEPATVDVRSWPTADAPSAGSAGTAPAAPETPEAFAEVVPAEPGEIEPILVEETRHLAGSTAPTEPAAAAEPLAAETGTAATAPEAQAATAAPETEVPPAAAALPAPAAEVPAPTAELPAPEPEAPAPEAVIAVPEAEPPAPAVEVPAPEPEAPAPEAARVAETPAEEPVTVEATPAAAEAQVSEAAGIPALRPPAVEPAISAAVPPERETSSGEPGPAPHVVEAPPPTPRVPVHPPQPPAPGAGPWQVVAPDAAPSETVGWPPSSAQPSVGAPTTMGWRLRHRESARPQVSARITHSVWEESTRDIVTRPGSGIQACQGCGLPLSASARFCRRCGARQD